MKLQELVNKLSNMLATMSGETVVHVEALGNQAVASKITAIDTEEGKIIIVG